MMPLNDDVPCEQCEAYRAKYPEESVDKETEHIPRRYRRGAIDTAGHRWHAYTIEHVNRVQLEAAYAENPYQYSPLESEDGIRLLEILPGEWTDGIECVMRHDRLPSCICTSDFCRPTHSPSYDALSYTWGDVKAQEMIYLPESDETLGVTANCYSALRKLRAVDKPRLVWVDAVCIDQNNILERNQQISVMFRIYRGAFAVVIDLGEDYDDITLAANALLEYSGGLARLNNMVPKPKEREAIIKLFARPWFNRVWVLQEVAWACVPIIMCGLFLIEWDVLFPKDISWLLKLKNLEYLPHVLDFKSLHMRKEIPFTPEGLLEHLCKARPCKSTDPRDKLFALLNLFHSSTASSPMSADYSQSTVQVFTKLAVYLLQNFGVSSLSLIQGNSSISDLPSWAPDWSQFSERGILGSEFLKSPFSAGLQVDAVLNGIQLPQAGEQDAAQVLRLRGVCCGVVRHLGDSCDIEELKWETIVFKQWRAIAACRRNPSDVPFVRAMTMFNGDAINSCGIPEEVDDRVPVSKNKQRKMKKKATSYSPGENAAPEAFYATLMQDPDTKSPWAQYAASEPTFVPLGLKMYKYRCGHNHGSLCFDAQGFCRLVMQKCNGRRFFITETGDMGLAFPEAQAGDIVCIFLGARVPYLLRQHDAGRFILVGECYVHGMMLGDAMKWYELSRALGDGQYAPFEDFDLV